MKVRSVNHVFFFLSMLQIPEDKLSPMGMVGRKKNGASR